MTILQWNLNGLFRHIEDLRCLIQDKSLGILALQETHLLPRHQATIHSFTGHRRDFTLGGRACGGVAIYVHDSIFHLPVPLRTTLQAVAVTAYIPYRVTICSLYLPPGEHVDSSDLDHLISQLPGPVLLLGDMNRHHTIWGSAVDSSSGRQLLTVTETHDLIPLNDLTPTHLCHRTGTLTNIDLSFSSSDIHSRLTWTVHPDSGSDHFPILISTDSDTLTFRSAPRYNTKKADWTDFENHILTNIDDVETVTDYLSLVTDAADRSIPKTRTDYKKPPAPWWNEQCSAAKQERKKAFRIFKTYPSPQNLLNYKISKGRAQYVFRTTRKQCWIDFLSSINKHTPQQTVWQNIQKIQHKKYRTPTTALKINETIVVDPQIISNSLGEYYSKISSNENLDPELLKFKCKMESTIIYVNPAIKHPLNEEISLRELIFAISQTKNTAPGPNNISNEIIKKLPEIALKKLARVFNNMFSDGNYPSFWQESIIIPVLKPNKDKLQASSYRPIALTDCTCKLFERILNNRLKWYLESQNLLSPYQCGFRRHRSTIDHAARLESDILRAFRDKKNVLAVSFDIDKAYDTIWRGSILSQLANWGISGNILGFVQFFLSKRTFRVRIGNVLSDPFPQDNGVTQGSNLSTTLFIVGMDNIKTRVPPTVKYCHFVDDFFIYTISSSIMAATERIQDTIHELEDWSKECGLQFSSQKSQCILFSNKRELPNLHITLNKVELPVVDQIKFLGLIMDRRLTWIPHLKELVKKSKKSLNLLRILGNSKWGADRKTLLTLYRAFTRSQLDYGCGVYSSASESALNMLDPIHHTGLRIATGAFRSSPTNSLCVEANEPPLSFRRNIFINNFILKTKAIQCSPFYNNINTQIENLHTKEMYHRYLQTFKDSNLENISMHPQLHSKQPPWLANNFKINTSLSKFKKDDPISKKIYKHLFLDFINTQPQSFRIFTDGSKLNGNVGSAAVSENKSYQFRLPNMSSVYTAELQAILLALKNVPTNLEFRNVIIFSDSLSAIQAINCMYTDHSIISNILEALYDLQKIDKFVTFFWIPGHEDISLNTIADEQAKLATTKPDLDTDKITLTDALTVTKSWILGLWENCWTNVTDNKLREIKNTTKYWDSSNRPTRREEVVLTRLRIGHTGLTHGHLMTREEVPTCRQCGRRLTVRHILTDCRNLDTWGLPHHLDTLLNNDSKHLDRLFKYLKTTKLLDLI